MKEIFRESTAFDQMLNAWDVGKVTIMRDTFKQASVFNQALSSWQVGNVTDMSSAFNLASNFDQSIETWDVSKTTNMYSMFNRATVFNQSLAWDTSKATSMALMFYEVRRGAEGRRADCIATSRPLVVAVAQPRCRGVSLLFPALQQRVLSIDTVSFAFSFASTHLQASSFNQDIDAWNVSQVTDMRQLFYRASAYDQPLGSWQVGRVRNMNQMFRKVSSQTVASRSD